MFFGNGITHALKCASPEGTPEELIEKMLLIFRDHYNRHCLDRTKPYDGIIDLMSRLKANGYKMAIVSNKIDSAVKELNDRFFSEYIDVAMAFLISKGATVFSETPEDVYNILKSVK